MRKNKSKKTLFIIVALALFLRLFTVFTQEESERLPLADAKQYDNIAVNIVSGHGFSQVVEGEKLPTAYRPPVYPLFLAAIYAVFGHSYIAVKIILALLGALFCIIVFFIASIMYDDVNTGMIAAFLTAVYKPFVSGTYYYGGPAVLYSEYFYMFITGLAILMTLFFIKRERKIFGILSGILIGLTILTRPEFSMYPVLLSLYLFYIAKFSFNKSVRRYFVMYLFIILTLTPWIARNYIVYKKFIPLSTIGGRALWLANNPLADGGWAYPEDYDDVMTRTEGMNEYDRDKILFKEAVEDLKSDPARIPGLFMKKIAVHWAPFEKGLEIFNPFYAFILFFASVGILFFGRRSNIKGVLLAVFLTTTLTTVVTLGDPRFRYPYESFLIVFAAAAIGGIFNLIFKPKRG